MSSNQPSKPTTQKNPVELLEMQVQILAELSQEQRKQQEQIEQLRAEQKTLTRGVGVIAESLTGLGQMLRNYLQSYPEGRVKIADVNMPFLSLVGFIIKVSLAAIPAYIIVLILAAMFIGLLSLFCGLSLFSLVPFAMPTRVPLR